MLKLAERVESDKLRDIQIAIEDHDSSFPILKTIDNSKTGQFTRRQIEEYIDQLDDVGLLSEKNLLIDGVTIAPFPMTLKAWCNNGVQQLIKKERAADNSPDGFYFHFETLAKKFLKDDQKTCADVDKDTTLP